MSDTPTTPHFLRIARALTLTAGVLSAGALAGCASSTQSDASTSDTASADSSSTDASSGEAALNDTASPDADPCSTCVCSGFEPPLEDGAARPTPSNACGGPLGYCCAAVGPLPPPELPALNA